MRRAIGLVPPDERWKDMKAIWDACKVAGVEPPEEVHNFFRGSEPEPSGIVVDIPQRPYSYSDKFGEHTIGIEIRVDDIPENVKLIRFYNWQD